MANVAIENMKSTIQSAIVRRIQIEAHKNRAQCGVVRGSCVMVGNKSYNATPVVDVYYTDGDTVWVIPDESSGHAIIIGN